MNAGSPQLFIVEGSKLPEVFLKVVEAKKLLQTGHCSTVNEAVARTGISRSAFYKYKDCIRPFIELNKDRIITFDSLLSDDPGVLSGILHLFAESGANILTINQLIPVDGYASCTIQARTGNMLISIDELIERAKHLKGVVRFELLASMNEL